MSSNVIDLPVVPRDETVSLLLGEAKRHIREGDRHFRLTTLRGDDPASGFCPSVRLHAPPEVARHELDGGIALAVARGLERQGHSVRFSRAPRPDGALAYDVIVS